MKKYYTHIPKAFNQVSRRTYAQYSITSQESDQDTSKTSHPTIPKQLCERPDCNEINCANDPTLCEGTMTTVLVAHMTHSTKGVEPGRVTVPLEITPGKTVHVVIYPKSEQSPGLYVDFKYHETKEIQKNENTYKLNEATKNQPEQD